MIIIYFEDRSFVLFFVPVCVSEIRVGIGVFRECDWDFETPCPVGEKHNYSIMHQKLSALLRMLWALGTL